MHTIGWRDIAFSEATGPIQFDRYTVTVNPEHVERWKDDPDGRFNLKVDPDSPGKAELGTFYPSL